MSDCFCESCGGGVGLRSQCLGAAVAGLGELAAGLGEDRLSLRSLALAGVDEGGCGHDGRVLAGGVRAGGGRGVGDRGVVGGMCPRGGVLALLPQRDRLAGLALRPGQHVRVLGQGLRGDVERLRGVEPARDVGVVLLVEPVRRRSGPAAGVDALQALPGRVEIAAALVEHLRVLEDRLRVSRDQRHRVTGLAEFGGHR